MKKLLLPILLFIASPSWATIYYVSVGANSTNCAAATNPSTPVGPTVLIGLNCLAASDTLRIMAGTYTTTSDRIHNSNNPFPGGSAGAPTVIEANPGDIVTLRPTGDSDQQLAVINLGNTVAISYVTVRNLIIDAGSFLNNAVVVANTLGGGGGDHIIISDNELTHGQGRIVGWGGSNGQLLRNIIHNTTFVPPGNTYACYCDAANFIMDGNDVYDIGGYGLHYYTGVNPGAIIRNNKFHNTGRDSPGTAILIYGANHQIYNNVFYNNRFGGIQTDAGSSGITIQENTIWNDGNIGNGQGVQAGIYPGGSQHLIRNNLVLESANGIVNAACSLCTINTNDTTGAGSASFVSTSGDFHLITGSPARNAGANLGAPYNVDKDGIARGVIDANHPAGAYDDGAYQFVSGSVPPPVDLPPLDDFVYTTSADLSGQNCTNGTIHCNNWTGPWSLISGQFLVDIAPSGSFSGGNAAHSNTTTTNYYDRSFGAFTTGSIFVQMRASVNNGVMVVGIKDVGGSNQLTSMVMDNDGQFRLCGHTSFPLAMGAYSINTWYLIEFNFDLAGHPNQSRARINEGTFSAWNPFCDAPSGAQGGRLYVYDSTSVAHDFWVDTVGAKSTSLTFTTQPVGPYPTATTFTASVGIAYSDGSTIHTSDTTSINMALCAGGPAGTFGGTTPKTPVSGISTFSDLSVTATNGGTGYTLCSTATGLVSATSNAFNITGVNQSPGIPGKRPRIRARIK